MRRRTVVALAVAAVLAAAASLVTWLVWDRFVLLAAGAIALGWLAGWALSGGTAAPADAEGWDPGPDSDRWAAEPDG